MIGIRSQSISEGSTAPTDDEICDQILGTRSCYIRDLGHGISAPSSSRSSKADIHTIYDTQLVEMQRQPTEDWKRTEQRADELAACVDEYQLLQTQIMERVVQME